MVAGDPLLAPGYPADPNTPPGNNGIIAIASSPRPSWAKRYFTCSEERGFLALQALIAAGSKYE